MAIVGVVVLAQTTTTITTTDIVFLGIEALLTVGVGLAMGGHDPVPHRRRHRTTRAAPCSPAPVGSAPRSGSS